MKKYTGFNNDVSYKDREKVLAYMLLSPVIFVYAVFIFYPVINGMINAFTNFSIFNPNPKFIFFENFKELFINTNFLTSLIKTVVFVIVVVIIQYCLGITFALLLSLELPGTAWLRNFAMLPWVLPVTATVLTFNWIFQADYGLLNIFLRFIGKGDLVRYWFGNIDLAFPAVAIIHIWRNVPFYGIVLYAGLKGISKDYYEAAVLDGASSLQLFKHIIMPLIKKQSIIVLLLHILFTFNNADIILLATGGGPVGVTDVLAVSTYNLIWGEYRFGVGTASAVMMFLILIPITLWSLSLSNKE